MTKSRRWAVGGFIVGAIAGLGVASSVTYAPGVPQLWFYATMIGILGALGMSCGMLVSLL